MEYTSNLGWCKDNEHHYYSTAKTAFNALNEHQRTLFTTNSAYAIEWARLSAWASANGDTLNGNKELVKKSYVPSLFGVENNENTISTFTVIVLSTSALISLFIYIKKKRKI